MKVRNSLLYPLTHDLGKNTDSKKPSNNKWVISNQVSRTSSLTPSISLPKSTKATSNRKSKKSRKKVRLNLESLVDLSRDEYSSIKPSRRIQLSIIVDITYLFIILQYLASCFHPNLPILKLCIVNLDLRKKQKRYNFNVRLKTLTESIFEVYGSSKVELANNLLTEHNYKVRSICPTLAESSQKNISFIHNM